MSDGPFPCEECGGVASFVVVMVELLPWASPEPRIGVSVSSVWFCADHEVLAFRAAHALRGAPAVLSVEVVEPDAVDEYLVFVESMIGDFLDGKALPDAATDERNRASRRARSVRRHRERRSGSLAQRARPHHPPKAS